MPIYQIGEASSWNKVLTVDEIKVHYAKVLEQEEKILRKSWDEHYIGIAKAWAEMGTCTRRQVGCVLVDADHKQLSSGFNGPPPKWEHCRDNPNSDCPAKGAPSGTQIDGCYSNHAEQNALNFCADVTKIHTVYVTSSPCITCIKALLVTSARRILFVEEYPHPEARDLWTKHSISFLQKMGVTYGHRTWQQFGNGLIYSSER